MAKYKVLEEIEVLGEIRAEGSEIEIDENTAASFFKEGKLEPVTDNNDNPPVDGESGNTPSTKSAGDDASTGGASAGGGTTTSGTIKSPQKGAEIKPKEGWVGNHTV